MVNNLGRWPKLLLLAGLLAGGVVSPRAMAQNGQKAENSGQNAPAVASTPSASPYVTQSNRNPRRASAYYGLVWGVESLRVKLVESGEIIRFTFSVTDPDLAKPLNDKKLEPALIDPQAGVRLEIPALEKVGKLRQTTSPEAGRSYWMAFSNKGRLVKRGDRVTIVIGSFHAEGLLVE